MDRKILRSSNAMLEEIEHRDKLLRTGNRAAQILLRAENEKSIEAALMDSMALVGCSADVDRVQIWRNELIDGSLYFVHTYEWLSDIGKKKTHVPIGLKIPYSDMPGWESKFLRGESLSGPISELPEKDQAFFSAYDTKTVAIIPLFLQDHFWGFFSIDDCRRERSFTEDEINILGSISLMMASAVIRGAQTAKIREAHERTKLLLDATPLACHLWNRKLENFDCNEENVRLFKLKNKQEILDNFYDFMPKYQPDGRLSSETAAKHIEKAFEEGRYVFEWMHQESDGTPIPTEVTLVRIADGDDHVVAGYVRDLREHKRIMNEIEQQEKLLNAVNCAASVLLTAVDEETFEESLLSGMELIGQCVDVDRIYITKNEIIDGKRHAVFRHEWTSSIGSQGARISKGVTFSYSAEWSHKFAEGECLNGPVVTLSPDAQAFFSQSKTKSVLIIPIFIQEHFWGFISFSDCENERFFTNEEIKILHSGALMMVNAINRNEQASEVREAHNRAILLLNSTPVGANLWDENINIFDGNEESVKLFNLKDKREYIARFFELSPKYQPNGRLSRELAEENIRKAFKEGKHVFEWMHQMLDGTPLPAEVTLVRVPYENDFAVAGYCRDLREYKKNMQEIEQRDYLLNTLNEIAGILLQTGLDNFAEDFHRCMGMLAEAVKVHSISIWRNITKDSRLYYVQVFEWISGAKTSKVNIHSIDTLGLKPYSETIPSWEETLSGGNCINRLVCDMSQKERDFFLNKGVLAVFATPVFIQDKFWGFVTYDNYNSGRFFPENEQTIMRSGGLVIANALLQNDMMQNLHAAAAQLEEALKEAQKANNAKSDFLARMSHEMRTPLTAVIGLSELSLEKKELDEETYSNLDRINNAGATLLSTVNDILDISKIEAGLLELSPVDYDVPSLINDTITQNILRIGEKSIKFVLELGEGMFSCLHGDELRVKQMMNNLLSNAIKYTDKGTVGLSLHCDREGDRVWLTIRVQDTGKGIKSEDMEKLFNDYVQMDLVTNRNIEGTGLGLPITKKLAEAMNGSISAESKYGKGSVFTVRIEQQYVADTHISPDVVESLKSFHYSNNKRSNQATRISVNLPYARVLLVDDNLTNLDVAKGLMAPYGMKIDCATSGQQAVDAVGAEEVRYNAIFMDHMMPGMNGMEATRLIREIGTDYAKNIPIIALTANAISGNEELFLSKGFQAFLSKPIDTSRLDEVIRRWVRDKEQERSGLCRVQKKRSDMVESSMGLNGLNVAMGIERFGGDKKVYMDVLRSYATNTRPLLQSIECVDEDKLADYTTIVHGIKASSRGIFADMIGASAERLEKAAEAGDYGYVVAHNPTLLAAVWKLIYDLESMFYAVDTSKQIKDRPSDETLSKLVAACKTYDMDAAEEAMSEIEKYKYEPDDRLAIWLRENVNLANFKQVIDKLSALTEEDAK